MFTGVPLGTGPTRGTMAEGQTLEQAFRLIETLTRSLNETQRTITKMQAVGGFADSKQLGMRSQRLEERVEKLEFDGTLHKDVTAHAVDLLANHLSLRHGIDLDRDNSPDVIYFRKIKRRLREWAEACGLMDKRRDVTGARNDENRLRPQAAKS